ncbi:MAG TPA: FadD3 family acyl-CoA ligase [Acidimicrobiales bacterium]|nr:FadD3 family acyl-CoA ligase [Acidimicrobiales bacterium]
MPVRGDLEWRSIPELAARAGERFGRAEAIVGGDRRLTFADVSQAAFDATRAAIAVGVAPGDRAAIWAPNSLEWILAALGVLGAGGIVVPINTRFKGAEAAFVLRQSGSTVLYTVNGFLGIDYVDLLRQSREDTPLRNIVVLSGAAPEDTVTWAHHVAEGQRVGADVARRRIDAVAGSDVSDIMFTSGTTGRPKGVITTHAQNLRAFADYTGAIGLREGDRYLIVNPFFHSFGFKAGWLGCLMRGATAFPQAVFDLDEVMTRIERERISVLPGPPTLLHGILEHPSRASFDLSSLRLTVTGAATIPVELIRRVRDEHIFEDVLTGYGLTETSGLVSVSSRDDSAEITANMSGRVADGIEVKVVDDAGAVVPFGTPGELLVRGYNVTQGYFGEPEETAKAIDADGWLRTGDVGTIDERGYVRITDRKKDMFIVGGFNADPAEIENLLLGLDAIAQVAVVGVPDERLGEVGAAFVIPKPAVDLTPADVMSFARTNMANYKVPRFVEIVDTLPVNASGKVLKYELRERARLIAAHAPTQTS